MADRLETAGALDPFEAAARRLGRPYARANAESKSYLPAVADFLKPETPLDYALLLFGSPGLIGKFAGKIPAAYRAGTAAAAGIYTGYHHGGDADAGAAPELDTANALDPFEAAAKRLRRPYERANRESASNIPGIVEAATSVSQAEAGKAKTLFEMSSEAKKMLQKLGFGEPQQMVNPGVYKRPDVIAREAAENVAPEHPALKDLFGVTRDDLYQIGQQGRRPGNIEPTIPTPPNVRGPNYAAAQIMTPQNAQRIVDTLGEAYKYPELVKGMVPWYVMDPAYQRMVKLVGPERAAAEYTKFNMHMTPFSGGSDVLTEINRGSAARMMSERGQFPQFQREAGKPPAERSADVRELLEGVKGHLMHRGHAGAVERYLATGEHGYGSDTIKIPLYMQASGVPQTGFQTRLAVPDTHFASAIGMPEVRKSANPRSFMDAGEYREVGPWYRENVAKPLGIEAVPGQALTWGVYGPQTGVRTGVGAGKLELLSQAIWERAAKLGIDPQRLRDDVLLGKQHALWLLGIPAAGQAIDAYEPRGGVIPSAGKM